MRASGLAIGGFELGLMIVSGFFAGSSVAGKISFGE